MAKFGRDQLKGTTKTQGDFAPGHQFNIEIDGIIVGGIHKIDGIQFEFDVIEYQDGDDMVTHYRPGRPKPGKITIEKDWSSTREFFNWRDSCIKGKVDRKSASVIFHNDAGEESSRINFFHCYPNKWTGPELNARSSAHATEKLEIVFEAVELKGG